MITTIILTICSTLVMFGLITSIAVMYYKLGKRLTKDSFYKHLDGVEETISDEKDSVERNLVAFRDDFYSELRNRDSDIDVLQKKIDSRCDKLNARIDKMLTAIEATSGTALKINDSI